MPHRHEHLSLQCSPARHANPLAPPRTTRLQRRMAGVLESREAHYAVIAMVLIDLAIVVAELALSSFYPTPELAPHLVHVAEEALSWTSIGILVGGCGRCSCLPCGCMPRPHLQLLLLHMHTLVRCPPAHPAGPVHR